MKRFYANNYNKIVLVVWTMFVFLIWLQYIYLSTLPEATLISLVLVPVICIVHILANVWLPRAIQKKNMTVFAIQFLGATFFNAFWLAACYQLIRFAGVEGYIPPSAVLTDDGRCLIIDFLFSLPSILVIGFGFCGLRFFYENIRLQKVNLGTQLQMLQAQINPHFMFNMLNHVHVLMRTDVELASGLLLQYSDLLRFQLYKGKADKVRLEEEILFLKNFVEIEKFRWGNKIKVRCNWDVANKNMEIPPLLLISFVENAFKYASRTIEQQRFVEIELKQENAGFSMEIQNSKSTANSQKSSEASGIGLDNTKKRLDLLFGKNYCLNIKDEESTFYLKLKICPI